MLKVNFIKRQQVSLWIQSAPTTDMSLQSLVKRLVHNGKTIYRYVQRSFYKDIVFDSTKLHVNPIGVTRAASPSGFATVIHSHARKLLVQNVLQRVTHTFNADLRKRATKRLFLGDSAPFFALVGVGLASNSGLLTKDDELEGICWEIRVMLSFVWGRTQIM